jgi:hypothetical protein
MAQGDLFYAKCGDCGFIGTWRRGVLRPPDGKIVGACPKCGSNNLAETNELSELAAFRRRMSGAPR